MTLLIDATYSPEDNKLRLYASERLDQDTYQRVKEMGFKWAPKQELFVAPSWTPQREDFCIELAGEITAEQTTLAERAEAKAERLDALAAKRAGQAVGFAAAAQRIAQRFEGGQPILVGHHSERKARKDQEQMDNQMRKAVEAQQAVSYWNYRAAGVEHHANRKNNSRTRANRIKGLLADMRKIQRNINHAHKMLDMWGRIAQEPSSQERDQKITHFSGYYSGDHAFAPANLWSKLDKGEMTPQEGVEQCLVHFERVANSVHYQRWINHILNRLAYETDQAGGVGRFEGKLTPVILQSFARTQGADKPKAKATETGFILESPAPLPLHLAEGDTLELSVDQWRELMQSVGYAVIEKTRRKSNKPAPAPLINPTPEQAEQLQTLWNLHAKQRKYGSASVSLQMVQARYSANSKGDYSAYSTIELDANGCRIWPSSRREKPEAVCRVRVGSGGGLYSADSVITVTDKPQKALPLVLDALIANAEAATSAEVA